MKLEEKSLYFWEIVSIFNRIHDPNPAPFLNPGHAVTRPNSRPEFKPGSNIARGCLAVKIGIDKFFAL